jgi:hypothetical protein
MTQRTVRTEADRSAVIRLIQQREIPFTLSIAKGANRSIEQNKLQRLWMKEAEEQGDMTAEEYRGLCKLHCGVPILRAENEAFRERYDRIVKPLPYEAKLEIMREPLDLPVTRLMTVDQHTRYLDAINRMLAEQGIALTHPETAA